MSLPLAPEPPLPDVPDINGRNGERQFNGAKLISPEEMERAIEDNTYIQQVDDFIQQDKAYILKLQRDIQEAMHPVRKIRRMIARMRERIYNRGKQRKHLIKRLRVKLAYEKIAKLRKELGINN